MKKLIIFFILFSKLLFAAQVQELDWQKGESLLTFLDRYSIPKSLYYNLPKEDKELCAEIIANQKYFLYTEDDGTLNQVLIPISEDIQLHIYKDLEGKFKFDTLPINYTEHTYTIAIKIKNSIAYDIRKVTGSYNLALRLKNIFKNLNLRKFRKGDYIALKYTQKELLGRIHGTPEISAAMIELGGKKYYRFRSKKDDKFYDEKAKGFTKSYFFQIPLRYKRISSHFTRKRWHPVLKRYRAHLGTDFAAPRGRKIYAAGNGRIIFKGRKGGYGKTIIIDHRNGYKTLYAHQNGFAKGIRTGKSVKKGQHIGYVGSTGLSSGPHLHLGLYRNGNAINALRVIRKPEYAGIKGKYKKTFIANAKNMIKQFNKEMKTKDNILPSKLNRHSYKNEIK